MKRSELKSIIKECLIEILEEGVTGAGQRVREAKARREQELNEEAPARRVQQQGPVDQVRALAKSPTIKSLAGANDMLAGILAQTATTTLRDQAAVPDPESMKQSYAATLGMMGAGGGGAYVNEAASIYSQPEAAPASAEIPWDAVAFGKARNSPFSNLPMPRKLSAAELDRKVG